jgi:translocation and assembly module TamA
MSASATSSTPSTASAPASRSSRAYTAGDTNIVYGRLSGEASIYSDFGTEGDFVGALRGRLGAIIGPNGAPPDRLFFAGGGGSMRGYEYQSVSPRDVHRPDSSAAARCSK